MRFSLWGGKSLGKRICVGNGIILGEEIFGVISVIILVIVKVITNLER